MRMGKYSTYMIQLKRKNFTTSDQKIKQKKQIISGFINDSDLALIWVGFLEVRFEVS